MDALGRLNLNSNRFQCKHAIIVDSEALKYEKVSIVQSIYAHRNNLDYDLFQYHQISIVVLFHIERLGWFVLLGLRVPS